MKLNLIAAGNITQQAEATGHVRFIPMAIIGTYPTAKAAIIKQFGIPLGKAKELVQRVRQGNTIIFETGNREDGLLGAVHVNGAWQAVCGDPQASFETEAEALAFAESVDEKRRVEGKDVKPWLVIWRKG